MATETKHDKFKRLADGRVNNALKNMQLIENLSNKSNYEYSQEDVLKIIKALKEGVNDLENCFNKKIKKGNKFEL